MKYITAILSVLFSSVISGQSLTKRVLFIGNSYTYVNNLPQLVADVASSMGDTLIFDSNTPGGESLYGHYYFEPATISKIQTGNWDYVVLQEQSQAPSLPTAQVINGVLPYAHLLDSVINVYNPCGETVFYMTWGRKNGDSINCAGYPNWQYLCTYEGMDSLINLRYRMMADSNHAILSPVGAVWHYIRHNFPSIELYQGDESHPSLAGSYAGACCFYTSLFRKDPALISFNSSLPAADAANIRNAVRLVVYDSLLNWHIGEYDPMANFTYGVSDSNEVLFTNISGNAVTYTWSFGDGDTSSALNPVHLYTSAGAYMVTLVATHCEMNDTTTQTIQVTTGIQSPGNQNYIQIVYPNPAALTLAINSVATGNTDYKIFNPLGEEILHGTITNGNNQIDIRDLSSGFYFLELSDHIKLPRKMKFLKAGN